MAKKRADLQGIWDFRLVFVSLTAPHAFPQATRRHIFDVPSHSQTMPIAFKEWAVTVRALAEGEQLVTLRRGLSHQSEKPFRLAHERFFLYPTFDHQPGDLVRESHQPELRRALEEGVWSDGEPHLQAFSSGAPVQQPDRVRIRAWAEVAGHFTIADPRCVDALSPFYVWTPDYAEKRLRWRPPHPLPALLLPPHPHPPPLSGQG